MFKIMALAITLTAALALPAIGSDAATTGPHPAPPPGAATDSGSAPGLRVLKVIEVTDGTTEYRMPVWSPDGKRLAFGESGFRGICVGNADGSGPISKIASGHGLWCLRFWTPDSKALLCKVGTRLGRIDVETARVDTLTGPLADDGHIDRNAYGDLAFSVWRQMQSLDFMTGSLKTGPYPEVEFLDPKTGGVETKYDYYSKERPASGDVQLEQDFRTEQMWIVAGDGVTRSEFPYKVLLASLSPARDKVAFLQGDGNIYVSHLDGSSMVMVGRGARWDWSPDGRRLAYIGAIEQSEWDVIAAEVFVVNADGSGAAQITHSPDIVEDYPTWSPGGLRIAYSGWNTGKIYVAILEEVK